MLWKEDREYKEKGIIYFIIFPFHLLNVTVELKKEKTKLGLFWNSFP